MLWTEILTSVDQGDSGIYFNGTGISPSVENSAILFAHQVLGSGP